MQLPITYRSTAKLGDFDAGCARQKVHFSLLQFRALTSLFRAFVRMHFCFCILFSPLPSLFSVTPNREFHFQSSFSACSPQNCSKKKRRRKYNAITLPSFVIPCPPRRRGHKNRGKLPPVFYFFRGRIIFTFAFLHIMHHLCTS